MSGEMSGEQMQAKIAGARRDAEGLKDKIKRKKDELADTSCKSTTKLHALRVITQLLSSRDGGSS